MDANDIKISGYEVLRQLGSGGMANVYLAVQRSLDRRVALKVMRRDIADLERFEQRFLVEGRTMAMIPHRNIVAVYDIVKGADSTYIAMEYLDGGSLSDRMNAGLSLGAAISIIVQVAQALQFAHERDVVHRDLKPANIMFRDAQTPVLTDFGIARRKHPNSPRLTESGMLVGTPTYMSPEQINDLDIDGRSDLYSLGILLHELLTGSPPFTGETPIAVLTAHLTAAPKRLPPELSDFQSVMDRLLAKNRDDRYASLREFCRALRETVINSKVLWTRLQSDLDDSLSDQLRALGFPLGGGATTPRSRAGQTPEAIAALGSARQVDDRQDAAKRLRQSYRRISRRTIAAGATVLVGILILGFVVWPDRRIDALTKRTVDLLLQQADEKLHAGDLVGAADYIQLSREQAPTYAEVERRAERLAELFKNEAEVAIGLSDFDGALAQVERARLILPEDPEITSITTRISDSRSEAERQSVIKELTDRASAAVAAGNVLGPGGAMALFDQALLMAPNNAQVLQLRGELVARTLRKARDALAAGELVSARTAINETAEAMAGEPEWRAIRLALEDAEALAAKRSELLVGLQRMDAQIRDGRLDSPAGNNASETLAEMQSILSSDPELDRRRAALARAYADLAESRLRDGDVEPALQSANQALHLQPELARAVELKRLVESRIDSRRARIIELIGKAQQAVLDSRFVEPPGASARDIALQLLEIDPGNQEANNLLQELPGRIAETITARSDAGDLEGAAGILDRAIEAYPEDKSLLAVSQQLSIRLSSWRAQRDRQAGLLRIAELLAVRTPSAASIGTAAREIVRLLAQDPQDRDAQAARVQLVSVIESAISTAKTPADLARVSDAIASAQQLLSSDGTAQQVASSLTDARARVAADEQSRIAASTGELLLAAYPWANVESLLDSDRRPVKLPAETTTPLRMSLPAGVYSVTFRHPQVGSPVTQVAQVQPKKLTTATASFASTIVGRDYLSRAGW